MNFSIGPATLPAHFVFETLAYTIGFFAYLRLRKNLGDSVSDSSRWTVVAAAIVGAALGSRLLFLLEDPALTAAHWRNLAYLMSGKTIVGGMIGGLAAVELSKWLIGEKSSTGDLFAAPIALGLAIGRVGCFFGGLPDNTYGVPTSLPWGVDFGDGIPRHPTQLYDAIFALALFALLWRMNARPHRNGDVFKAMMAAYMAWRLGIDFLKPEIRFAGLSAIQWACAVTLAYYARDIVRWMRERTGSSAVAGKTATRAARMS